MFAKTVNALITVPTLNKVLAMSTITSLALALMDLVETIALLFKPSLATPMTIAPTAD